MKAKYAQLVANGKAAKVVLTAIMRKLLVLANALLKNGRTWMTNEDEEFSRSSDSVAARRHSGRTAAMM
jgi:hypothetical protein